MPIATPQGTLDFKSVDAVTFVGVSSNTVIDTTTGSFGVGVDGNGPTSNLHVVGNAYISTDLTVVGDIDFSGTFNQNGAPFASSPWTTTGADLSYTTGNVSLGKELTVTGNVSVSDDLTVTGAASVSNVVTIGTTKTFVVKVGSNGKYEIDGVDRPTLHLHQHQTYIFDLSDSSLIAPSVHPFIFSETASGSSYDTGITTTGAYGSTEKRTFVVPAGAPTTLYYYCTSHSGMGATASISSTAELMVSGRVESIDLAVTGTSGISIGSGTTAQRPANPTLGTIRYNSTTGFMEGYAAAGWAPIAQPPTVTGLSPLTTLTSGGALVGWVGTDTGPHTAGGTRIVADDGANGDLYGYRVAISGDGTKVVVGSHAEEASTGSGHRGAAYIYTLSDGSWSQTAKLLASDQSGTNASFGVSQAMNSDGTKVIIGAQAQGGWGAAYIYTYSSGSWSQEGSTLLASDKQADDQFGQSVSMNSDGTRVIVGAFWEAEGGSTAGAAYVFAYNGTSWAQEDKLVASDAQSGDWFGEAVSMSSDGTRVVVGARLEASSKGAAYVFNFSSGSWDTGTKIPVPSDIVAGDYLGQTVSISGDGTKVLIGAPADHSSSADSGSVYVFTYNGSSWVQEVKLTAATPGANAQFGMGSVSMNSDGTKIIVGEYQDYGSRGAAHIFTYSSGSWDSGLKIVPTSRTSSGVFGAGAAMSSDGTRVIVGEHENGVGKGSAYIFDYNSNQIFDSATQVFTATGTGIVSGSTVQLEGADGTLYSVFDATAAGTQVTFKMGTLGASGAYTIANQPYKLKVNSTSGLIGTSTAVIGFAVGWTTAAGATLLFDIAATTTQTLVGTDGGGGTNRTFSLAPGSNALPSGLQPVTAGGAITGTIAAVGTTSVTFRLTDNGSGLFTDRAINIVGATDLYTFSPNPFKFTCASVYGHLGPELATLTGHADYSTAAWRLDPTHFNLGKGYYPNSGSDASTPQRGFQLWTVPANATYTIQAQGALGGDSMTTLSPWQTAGKGARVQADFTLTKGTKIIIIVGQGGLPSTSASYSSGGGGGTFVLKNNFHPYGGGSSGAGIDRNDIYLIAGGGTGTSEYGNTGMVGLSANGSSQGTSHAPYNSQGGNSSGGGGGWGQNGTGSTTTFGKSVHNFVDTSQTDSLSQSVLVKPGQGGVKNQSNCGNGGFGGGGAGQDQTPGGGGGYGSGRGGYYSGPQNYTPAATSWIMPNGTTGITVANRTFLGNPGGTLGWTGPTLTQEAFGADFNGWVLITKN
jgi:hypothetical protein